VSQFRAIALLNQWREVHVCYVHVHHQLGNVVDGERYAAIRNAVLMRINVSSGKLRWVFMIQEERNQNLKSSSSKNELISSCADGLLEPSIILVRMLEMTCGFERIQSKKSTSGRLEVLDMNVSELTHFWRNAQGSILVITIHRTDPVQLLHAQRLSVP